MSKLDYIYNPVGTIATWWQQADSNTPTQYALTYDNADQLISAVQTNTSTSATVSSNAYNYDPAGNRLAETTLTGTTAGQFNKLNQLLSLSSSTSTQTIAGNTSAAVTNVTINAVPAILSNSTNFTANVPLSADTNTISIVAKPSAGAPTTQRYQVISTGTAPTSPSYDANGNTLTDENGNTYQWDALNRLTKITYPSSASSLFAYDGLSHRTQIVEKNASGTVTSTKNYLWIGSEIAEERDASNTVTKRFFPQGEQQASTNYYYTKDHLGSVREMCNSSGTVVSRISYDPYGRTTLVSGSNIATFQYAGDYYHATSGLYLTKYRAYDPNTGRWISRDPANEDGGMNLYGFCSNDPADNTDASGLAPTLAPPAPTVTPVDPVPPDPVPPDFPPGFVVPALVIFDVTMIIYDADQVAQIINSERDLEQMEAANAAQEALNDQLANCPKPCRGLLRQLLAHMKTLSDYMNNPDAFDNKDLLKNAKSPEERQEIIQGRINNLRGQIANFAKQYKECLEKNSPPPPRP